MPNVDALASLYLFQHVPRASLQALLDHNACVRFGQDSRVFELGDVADSALLLMSGRLEAILPTQERPARSGNKATETNILLGDIRPGEVVGETALFVPGGRRQARVIAAEPSVGLVLRSNTLLHNIEDPAIIALQRHLIGTLGRRIRATNRHLQQRWRRARHDDTADSNQGLIARLRAFFGAH